MGDIGVIIARMDCSLRMFELSLALVKGCMDACHAGGDHARPRRLRVSARLSRAMLACFVLFTIVESMKIVIVVVVDQGGLLYDKIL